MGILDFLELIGVLITIPDSFSFISVLLLIFKSILCTASSKQFNVIKLVFMHKLIKSIANDHNLSNIILSGIPITNLRCMLKMVRLRCNNFFIFKSFQRNIKKFGHLRGFHKFLIKVLQWWPVRELFRSIDKQECIPVGCVPPASMVISMGRGVSARGGGCPPGVCVQEGVDPETDTPCPRCRHPLDPEADTPWTQRPTPPTYVNRMTDKCKNIAFPQLRLRPVKNQYI